MRPVTVAARVLARAPLFVLSACSDDASARQVIACKPASAELRTAIARQVASHVQGKRDGDLAATIGIFNNSVQLFGDDGAVIRGRAALEATYREIFTQLRFDSLAFVPREVRDCGGVLVELGEAQGGVTPIGQAPIAIHVRYLHLWERSVDGAWLLVLAMDQTLAP